MDLEKLRKLLTQHEGIRAFAYDDATGKPIGPGSTLIGHPTIGVGRALDVHGISRREISMMLNHDMIRVYKEADKAFPWFRSLSESRQMVIMSMVFNMGISKVRGFKKMISAIGLGQYELAASEMLASAWAAQVGERAIELSTMMKK